MLQTDHFPIQHGMMRTYRVRHFLRELWPLAVDVAVSRDEPAAVAVDDGEGAEAVVLQLEKPVGMVEWFRCA